MDIDRSTLQFMDILQESETYDQLRKIITISKALA